MRATRSSRGSTPTARSRARAASSATTTRPSSSWRSPETDLASGSWAAQQLAEFLDAVSRMRRRGAGRPSRASSAPPRPSRPSARRCCATARSSPRSAGRASTIPERGLLDLTRGGRGRAPRPRRGRRPRRCALRLEDEDAHLVVVRAGEPLVREEQTLLRGMARSLALTMRLLRTIEAERAPARPVRPAGRRERAPARDAAQAPARAGGDGPHPARDLAPRAAAGRAGDDRRRRRRAARRRRARRCCCSIPTNPGWLTVAAARGYEDDGVHAAAPSPRGRRRRGARGGRGPARRRRGLRPLGRTPWAASSRSA